MNTLSTLRGTKAHTLLRAAGLAIAIAGLAACTMPPAAPASASSGPSAPSQAARPVGLANPASVACVQAGGQLQIERSADGERGICLLPGGLRCDEWAWFRKEPQACCATGAIPAGSDIKACR